MISKCTFIIDILSYIDILEKYYYNLFLSAYSHTAKPANIKTYFVDYLLVAEKRECEGNGHKWSGYFPSVTGCAASCQSSAKMFSYDRRVDCGTECNCYCWKDSEDGTCKEGQKETGNYNLYRFKQQGNLLVYFI